MRAADVITVAKRGARRGSDGESSDEEGRRAAEPSAIRRGFIHSGARDEDDESSDFE